MGREIRTDFVDAWVSVPVAPDVATALCPYVTSVSATSARGRKTSTANAA